MAGKMDKSLLKGLGHEKRRAVLRVIAKSGDHLSPVKVSRLMDVPLNDVAYHVRVLEQCGALALIDTRQVRGATEHFYRITPKLRDTKWAWDALELDDPRD